LFSEGGEYLNSKRGPRCPPPPLMAPRATLLHKKDRQMSLKWKSFNVETANSSRAVAMVQLHMHLTSMLAQTSLIRASIFNILCYSMFVTLMPQKFFFLELKGRRGKSCVGLFYCFIVSVWGAWQFLTTAKKHELLHIFSSNT